LPCSIYADVVHHCTVTGEYQTEIKYLTQSKADYVDTANRQHYVQILAEIDSQGNVTDRRLLSPFLGMNPLTLDDTTENNKDKQGHTHKLPIASLVKKGIVKLFSGYDSDAEDMAATPKAIKGLKELIDAITRNLGNYIPNSKKSSAVDSNSAENVATSAAVKTANDNANGRVSKSGDTMTGHLIIKDGDYSSVRTYNNDGESVRWESTPANNNDIFAKIVLAGKNEQVISSISLPKKSGTAALLEDVNKVKNDVYNKSRFSHRYYANHYEGAEVYDMPIGDREVMRVIIMGATIDGYAKVSLPERFSGTCRVMVMDVGSGRHVVGANIQDYNKVEVHNIGRTGLNIMAIGYYSW